MAIDNIYGIASTDDIQLEKAGLPVGTYKVMIVLEEADTQRRGVVVGYEILDGEYKGKRGKQWILTTHSDQTTANIAKQTLKRIAEATGRAISPAAPMKNRVMTIKVMQQKKNPEYTEIKGYYPENYKPSLDEEIPF